VIEAFFGASPSQPGMLKQVIVIKGTNLPEIDETMLAGQSVSRGYPAGNEQGELVVKVAFADTLLPTLSTRNKAQKRVGTHIVIFCIVVVMYRLQV